MSRTDLWTPALDTELTRLRIEGLTFGRIALRMGVTKNQVVGRAARIGLLSKQGKRPEVVALAGPALPAPRSCQWISNDDMRNPAWCDQPVREGSSWCAAHHARAFVRSPSPTRLKRAEWNTRQQRAS